MLATEKGEEEKELREEGKKKGWGGIGKSRQADRPGTLLEGREESEGMARGAEGREVRLGGDEFSGRTVREILSAEGKTPEKKGRGGWVEWTGQRRGEGRGHTGGHITPRDWSTTSGGGNFNGGKKKERILVERKRKSLHSGGMSLPWVSFTLTFNLGGRGGDSLKEGGNQSRTEIRNEKLGKNQGRGRQLSHLYISEDGISGKSKKEGRASREPREGFLERKSRSDRSTIRKKLQEKRFLERRALRDRFMESSGRPAPGIHRSTSITRGGSAEKGGF